MRQGICSVCQGQHPVMLLIEEYVIFDHNNLPGRVCPGSGWRPESVLGDSIEQRERDEWDSLALEQDYWEAV